MTLVIPMMVANLVLTMIDVDVYCDCDDGGDDLGYANDVTMTLVMEMMM